MVGVIEGTGVMVRVGVGVWVACDVTVGVGDTVDVFVGKLVTVKVGEAVEVLVAVGVGVSITTGGGMMGQAPKVKIALKVPKRAEVPICAWNTKELLPGSTKPIPLLSTRIGGVF